MFLLLFIFAEVLGSIPFIAVMAIQAMRGVHLHYSADNPMDLTGLGISGSFGILLAMMPFVLGFVAFVIFMKPVHQRPFQTLLTGASRFRWNRFGWAALVWFALLSAYSLVAHLTGIETFQWNFNPNGFIGLILVAIVIIPLQTGFEEVLFRGYLMQGFARLTLTRWVPLIVTTLIFGSLHFANPEVKEYGAWMVMPQYLWFGLFFGICTIMDNGLELAWGAHTINNIFGTLFVTQEASAIPTKALFSITKYSPSFDILALVAISAVFIWLAAKRYQWAKFSLLFKRIHLPLTEYNQNEIIAEPEIQPAKSIDSSSY
ncbi:abortive infection protein [Prolixibacter bellariivorans]|uniref:Abortive infection protein n=2 Tax=Prolixibacter bellariivorans TaxID=314319 RepID=A0A5M4AW01_9BACT|nr:abortive infection protein [Prolixibacter bellariivorans]